MAKILTAQAIYYEAGVTQYPFAALANSGDNKTFADSRKPWSQATGSEAVIAPYGVITGGAITPDDAAANNTVDVAALTAMMPGATGASATTGILTVAASANLAITRAAAGGAPYKTTSITITAAGAIAAVAGTDGAAQVETRGAAGGPPFIPVDSIEIGQVRLGSITAAPIAAGEIYQVPGLHQERADLPVYSADYLAGKVTFASALPPIHTGSVAKRVYARVALPIFAEIPNTKDWVPAKETLSVQSDAYYDGVVGSSSSSIGAASFSVALNDGHGDLLVQNEGKNLLWMFKPDKNGAAYSLTQGAYSIAQTFGVKAAPTGTVTIAAQQATRAFAA
jgi:hypothetical protein